jgi:phosphoketolase
LTSFSHINAETPGSIHEGGELGYALAVSFGAVMDNPNLIAICVIGDGEAETGATATYVSRCGFYPLWVINNPFQELAWPQIY